jgi:hypothetical protein
MSFDPTDLFALLPAQKFIRSAAFPGRSLTQRTPGRSPGTPAQNSRCSSASLRLCVFAFMSPSRAALAWIAQRRNAKTLFCSPLRSPLRSLR